MTYNLVEERLEYFTKHNRISSYDSENIIYNLLKEILNNYKDLTFAFRYPLNILIKDIAIDNLKVGVKTRYSKKESIATLHTLENNKIKIIFNEPEKSLTPGQSAVFYLDDIVVGGGIIEQAL
mgnify:CR=1 FL=1